MLKESAQNKRLKLKLKLKQFHHKQEIMIQIATAIFIFSLFASIPLACKLRNMGSFIPWYVSLLQKRCWVSQNKRGVSQQNPKTRDHKRCIWNMLIPGGNRAYISCYIRTKPGELGLGCQWEQSLWLSWWPMSTFGTGSKAKSILPLPMFHSGSHSPC